MKKCHIVDYNGVWENVGIESVPIEEAEIILHFQDIDESIREQIRGWQALGKKVIVMQHGRSATSDYIPPRSNPLIADYFFAWGTVDVEALESVGITNYVHTGSLLSTHLKPRIKNDQKRIVYCPSDYGSELEEHAEIASKLRETQYHITTKLVHGHVVERYDNPVVTDRAVSNGHLDSCIEVLRNADVVVSLFDATFELLAAAMDIPVIVVNNLRERTYLNVPLILPRSPAVHQTTLKNLPATIESVLKNPEKLHKERREVVMKEGGFELDAKTRIHAFLETI